MSKNNLGLGERTNENNVINNDFKIGARVIEGNTSEVLFFQKTRLEYDVKEGWMIRSNDKWPIVRRIFWRMFNTVRVTSIGVMSFTLNWEYTDKKYDNSRDVKWYRTRKLGKTKWKASEMTDKIAKVTAMGNTDVARLIVGKIEQILSCAEEIEFDVAGNMSSWRKLYSEDSGEASVPGILYVADMPHKIDVRDWLLFISDKDNEDGLVVKTNVGNKNGWFMLKDVQDGRGATEESKWCVVQFYDEKPTNFTVILNDEQSKYIEIV